MAQDKQATAEDVPLGTGMLDTAKRLLLGANKKRDQRIAEATQGYTNEKDEGTTQKRRNSF